MRYRSALTVIATLACAHSAPASAKQDDGQIFLAGIVDSAPAIIHCAPPSYPDTLRQAGIQGRVLLQLIIDTLGRPERASLRALTSPHDLMASTAINAMQACQFTPARVRGRAVRVLVQIPLDFKIHGS